VRIGVAVSGGRPQSVDLVRVSGAGQEAVVGRFEREDDERFVLRTRIEERQTGLVRFVARAQFAAVPGDAAAPAVVRSPPIVIRVTKPARTEGLTVDARGLTLQVPAGWHVQSESPATDRPIVMRNVPVARGGVLPAGACAIEATSSALTPRPIRQVMAQELEASSIQGTNAGGRSAMRAEYREIAGSGLEYEKSAVYIPGGSQLHKLFLAHRAGDPIGPRCRAAFNLVVNTARIEQ
jgi:hypothetical protein